MSGSKLPWQRLLGEAFVIVVSVYLAIYLQERTDDRERTEQAMAKLMSTEGAFRVINDAMQIMGGIGYTNVYPIERYLRDGRLSMIWTGTSEIMNGLVQHEYYKELMGVTDRRDIEKDATAENPEAEKIYTD